MEYLPQCAHAYNCMCIKMADAADLSELKAIQHSQGESVAEDSSLSILSKLRAPEPSDLARKRQVKGNPGPPIGKKW